MVHSHPADCMILQDVHIDWYTGMCSLSAVADPGAGGGGGGGLSKPAMNNLIINISNN